MLPKRKIFLMIWTLIAILYIAFEIKSLAVVLLMFGILTCLYDTKMLLPMTVLNFILRNAFSFNGNDLFTYYIALISIVSIIKLFRLKIYKEFVLLFFIYISIAVLYIFFIPNLIFTSCNTMINAKFVYTFGYIIGYVAISLISREKNLQYEDDFLFIILLIASIGYIKNPNNFYQNTSIEARKIFFSTGTHFDPNIFVTEFTTAIMLLNITKKKYLIYSVIIFVLNILFFKSLTGFVVIILGVFLVLKSTSNNRKTKISKLLSYGLGISVIIISLLFFAAQRYGISISEVFTIDLDMLSSGRISIWGIYVNLIKQNPIGYGINMINYLLNSQLGYSQAAHSMYLEGLSEIGVVFGILYLLIPWIIIIRIKFDIFRITTYQGIYLKHQSNHYRNSFILMYITGITLSNFWDFMYFFILGLLTKNMIDVSIEKRNSKVKRFDYKTELY